MESPKRKLNKRAEFTQKTKRLLADRAGYECSFPGCGARTIGPSKDSDFAVSNGGTACHIYSATGQGPRPMPSMSPEQLSSPENGIWMCAYHGRIIDNDDLTYPHDVVREMKRRHEDSIHRKQKYGYNLSKKDNGNLSHDEKIVNVWKKYVTVLFFDGLYSEYHNDQIIISDHTIECIDVLLKEIPILMSGLNITTEIRFSMHKFIDSISDLNILIGESDPGTNKYKYYEMFMREKCNGRFFYLVDTDNDLISHLHRADGIEYGQRVMNYIRAFVVATAHQVILAVRGSRPSFEVPVLKEIKSEWIVKEYPGLESIRKEQMQRYLNGNK